MGIFKRRKKDAQSAVAVSSEPKEPALTPANQALVEKLTQDLQQAGVIEKPADKIEAIAPVDSLDVMFEEAQRGARYEKELNPEFYRPEVEELLRERAAQEEDWANPDLEGLGTGANKATPDELRRARMVDLTNDDEEDALSRLMEEYE